MNTSRHIRALNSTKQLTSPSAFSCECIGPGGLPLPPPPPMPCDCYGPGGLPLPPISY